MKTLLLAVFAVGLFACATAKPGQGASATAAAPSAGKSEKPPDVEQPRIGTHAMLEFEDANKLCEQAKHAAKPDYEGCARKYEAALAADEKFAEAEYNLGVIAERQGHPDEASQHYRRALDKNPSLKAAAVNQAVLAENKGDKDRALAIFADIAQHFPDDGASRAHIALLLQQSGDDERALRYAREALMRDPRSYPAQKALMLAYFDKKQLSMARLVALRAMKVNDQDPDLYYVLGLMFQAEKQDEKARIQFNKALSVKDGYLPAHVQLAKVAVKEEDFSGAQSHLARILQADPNNAEAHLDMGVAYKGMGQFDKAMLEYDAAEKLNPKLAGIYLNRGIILHRFKDSPEKGIAQYKKYIDLRGDLGMNGASSVMTLMKEAEQIVSAKAQAAQMEAEAKRNQELQAKQQEAAKQNGVQGQGAAPVKPANAKGPGSTEPASAKAPAPQQSAAAAAAKADLLPDPPAPEPAPKAESAPKPPADDPSGPPEPKDGM
jgi:tetratricopeptide (TPR) repeat protein